MATTALGKNEAINSLTRGSAATAWLKFVGLFKTAQEKVLTAENTKIAKFEITGSEAAGYTNEKVIVFTEINGSVVWGEKVGGLFIGRPYFIKGAAANSFEVAEEQKAGVVTPTVNIKVTTKIALVEEISGGTYARIATAFAVASLGIGTDTEKIIQVPAATTVTFAGWWLKAKQSEETKAHEQLVALERLELPEVFAGAGEYKLTSDKLEGNPVA